MKRRLAAIYWLGILITLVMASVAIGMAVKLKIDDTRSNLTAMLEAASRWTLDSNDDLQSLAEDIAAVSPPMRVTFMMDSGLMLADSMQNGDPTTNHFNDAELAAARRGEIGRTLRMSSTSATYVLYMAKRLSPQLILRVSYPVFEVAKMLIIYGVAVLGLFLVLYRLQRGAIARFARDQSRQLEDVRRLIDGETDQAQAVFPEFQPSLDAIAYRAKRLREDYEEIVRTMRLRSDFVANASHELRSPLTSVKGFAEMLEEGLADTPEEQALCLSTIRSECDRMLQVIEKILHLSKAERSGTNQPDLRAAAPVADEVLRALRPMASKKNITLRADGNTILRMEERELWEVLFNLADNAVRYGRRDGHVSIQMNAGNIIVEDDGIGISSEHIEHIFEQFYRVDEMRNADQGGTGLGLSIVKAIVERYGGTIRAESVKGEGSRLILDFPVEE